MREGASGPGRPLGQGQGQLSPGGCSLQQPGSAAKRQAGAAEGVGKGLAQPGPAGLGAAQPGWLGRGMARLAREGPGMQWRQQSSLSDDLVSEAAGWDVLFPMWLASLGWLEFRSLMLMLGVGRCTKPSDCTGRHSVMALRQMPMR